MSISGLGGHIVIFKQSLVIKIRVFGLTVVDSHKFAFGRKRLRLFTCKREIVRKN